MTYPCRVMPTRHCPIVYGAACGEKPCARFESNDVQPWDWDLFDGADYIVIRPAPDLPEGFLPASLDGIWYDRNTIPIRLGAYSGPGIGEGVAVPAGRFEVRDDGAVAEVWEVRP